MAAATDQQVQQYVDQRLRPMAELLRKVFIMVDDNKAAIEDVYDACDPPENATWTDERTDGPPSLLGPTDVLVFNTILFMLQALKNGTLTDQNKNEFGAVWLQFQQACVRPVEL